MIGERLWRLILPASLADTAISGVNNASNASWYKCRSSTDISPALLNSLPLTMIFAFSFAASRAPEWSGGISSTARSYAALTSTGISSAFAYSRPLNRIFVLGLALTKRPRTQAYFSRNSSAPSFMGGRIRFCDAGNPAIVVDLHLNSCRGLMCALQAVAA